MDGKTLLVYILYGHGIIFVPFVRCLVNEYHFINIQKSWTDAQQYCREHFTDLATLESGEDMNRIEMPAGVFSWIGLYDKQAAWYKAMTADPNSWRWSATGTTSPGGYQYWASTEPNNWSGEESCVFIQNNVWKDYVCTVPEPCLCYKVQSDVKQFFLVNDALRTWVECQSVCRQQYQDLATIESVTESQAALAAMTGESAAWIGLYRNSWFWSDLSKSSFRNWNTGSPDNNGGNQHCVTVGVSGLMGDNICSSLHTFICHRVIKRGLVQTQLRIQTNVDLSKEAITEQLFRQLEEKLEEKIPEAVFKLQWSKAPTKEGYD